MNRHYVIPVREVEQVLHPSYTECVSAYLRATGERQETLRLVVERELQKARRA